MDTAPPETATRTKARDAGSASVEAVIATPVLMLLVLAIIQAGLILHANHMAQAAAHTAMEAARAELATGGDGTAAAEASLARNATGVLEDPSVTVARGTERVTVTVTGNATRIIPLFDAPVEATVSGAVEHIEPLEGGD
ncbi:TadE/TadG family type IV pilus assembly protein [Glycomyces tenuis]|uniref:TadE/TadG family type IV pilus assembly protein n=1 Tax=Glycomyces tenuis TaxID=58116 RepID=UPI000422F5B8|nr:TadE family protein [Glycomyces tenuis]